MNKSKVKLMVIIDPTNSEQIALEKALLIASLTECEIHAFACVYEEIADHGEYSSIKDMKHHVLRKTQKQLNAYMQPCLDSNIKFSTEISWNKYWYETAIHAAARSGSDMVIKSSYYHSKATRFFNTTSDFTLMRFCASPILFTHRSQSWQSNHILACVDLESTDSQHTRLNNGIIRTAKAMSETLGMKLYIAAAYENNISDKILQNESKIDDTSATGLAEIFGVNVDNMILRKGPTVETIHDICVEVEPSILVIGSIARTGVSAKLIGNTAEKLLDVVDADILTIS